MQFMFNNCNTGVHIKFDRDWILSKANVALEKKPVHITDAVSPLSAGGIHDYYSNGDYWWPNPDTYDGLPFMHRDGESYPNAFFEHRIILRRLRSIVANLSAGYKITGDEIYAKKAVQHLKEFFIDDATRMNPNLLYSQAIPGVCNGRGIGIIDTLQIIDVPLAIEALKASKEMLPEIYASLIKWFADYLKWMSTHQQGLEEMNAKNNHSVTWFVQAAVFALFTVNHEMVDFCRERYKKVLLPNQMAINGSFPEELRRTKPYSYSIFILDNMITLCHLLSKSGDNLWNFELEDGRSIKKGLEFLFPYLDDKSKWIYPRDIQHFNTLPVRSSFLIFAGLALNEEKYVKLWEELPQVPDDIEIRRNIAIRQPILWV